jgi:hypothetical protein
MYLTFLRSTVWVDLALFLPQRAAAGKEPFRFSAWQQWQVFLVVKDNPQQPGVQCI